MTLGGNYGFNNGFKIIAFGQYFHDQELTARARAGVGYAGLNAITGGKGYGYVDGWGIGVGAHYPVLGGTAKVAVNYRDMDNPTSTAGRLLSAMTIRFPRGLPSTQWLATRLKRSRPRPVPLRRLAANSIWASFTASNRMRIPVSV